MRVGSGASGPFVGGGSVFASKMAGSLRTLADAVAEMVSRSAVMNFRFPPDLLERLRNLVPPNWQDLEDPDYEAALRIMNGGIPLIWVPRSSIVSRLICAEDAAARDVILAQARPDIADDCLAALAEISDPDLMPLRGLALQAADALKNGYCAPAQALATNVVDTWLRAAVGRGVAFEPVPGRKGWYEKVRAQISFVSEDLHIAELKPTGALAPVSLALQRFDSRVNPKPEQFGRHATAHAAYPEQYTPANAVIAVMLMTSVLRQSGESGW